MHSQRACVVLIALLKCHSAQSLRPVRAISLDITGTLITHKGSIVQHYVDAAVWAQLDNPPSVDEMKPAFKEAYKERFLASPCFGGAEGISGRDWWRGTARRVMELCGRSYAEEDFDRWFRRVYQHFGSPNGYEVLPDAATFLNKIPDSYLLGICSNTPNRHSASVLPMLGIHEQFKFFASSQDVGHEKPHKEIFEDAFRQAQFWLPDLKREEVLHVGDSLACDFCGAKAFGFQALLLDRSGNEKVTSYQDWVEATDYEGKSAADIENGTVQSLADVVALVEISNAEPGAFIRVM